MTALDVRSESESSQHPHTPGRVTFNRPPRLRPTMSVQRFDVPLPPPPVQKPTTSFSSGLVIPIVAVAAMGSLFMVGGIAQGNSTYLILSVVALGFGSALPTAWIFFEDRRKFARRAREQVVEHGRRLRNAELELQRLRLEEQELRESLDPAPEALVRRALARGRRLFERRLSDPDFLQLRLGTGLAASLVEIEYRDDKSSESTADLPPELERMRREGRHISDQYRQLPDVPIGFDLKKAGAVGLAGHYARTGPLARSLLAQMAVQHSPDDLRLVAYLGSRPIEDWAWLKWLPHARSASPTLAWDPLTQQALSAALLDELTARKRALEDVSPIGGDSNRLAVPWLVVFVDDLPRAVADPAIRMALADGLRLRVALLGLVDDAASVPGGCRGVAMVDRMLTYAETGLGGEPVECLPDTLDVDAAEQMARALAPLDVLDEGAESGAADIPSRITFFESLGIANIAQLDVASSWRLDGVASLLRTPLGPTAGGETLWLDLKEQSLGGHGPHGLVAGTTGAGKSELLLTLIAGLAMRQPPDVLNFVLVDYKGGDAFQTVADLPHTIALITDLDKHLAARALVTLRSEIKRREHRLLELRAAGISSLADYQLRRPPTTSSPVAATASGLAASLTSAPDALPPTTDTSPASPGASGSTHGDANETIPVGPSAQRSAAAMARDPAAEASALTNADDPTAAPPPDSLTTAHPGPSAQRSVGAPSPLPTAPPLTNTDGPSGQRSAAAMARDPAAEASALTNADDPSAAPPPDSLTTASDRPSAQRSVGAPSPLPTAPPLTTTDGPSGQRSAAAMARDPDAKASAPPALEWLTNTDGPSGQRSAAAMARDPAAPQDPMPFLVIVVDEFARLKDELPEFISGLIDVARVGRSLGVHLILATQTPSGTVDDQIQKNSNFGISLRVRDAGDSKQVIGEPDAALLPGSLPGRGYFRAGLEPIKLFQTARVGAPYYPRASHASFEVVPFEPRISRRRRSIAATTTATASAEHHTEVRALVAHLKEAAQQLNNAAKPWPNPLPDVVALIGSTLTDNELAPRAIFTPRTPWTWQTTPPDDWLVTPVGLVDEPTQQSQGPFRLDVSRNCMVYGGPGSGKSTFLRTLATSLALTHAPDDLHLYCLDFDARTLAMFRDLPHCGEHGVFFPRDTVRIRRLIRLLEHELHQRREAGIINLKQQRRATTEVSAAKHYPFIVVMLDNFAAFRETFEEEENLTRSMDSMVADFASLMRDGPAAGIHFVLTAGAGASIPNSIANAAETRVAMRMGDSSDYGMIGRLENVPERLPPGRGFAIGTPPREFQVALLPDEVEAATQLSVASSSTSDLFAQLRAASAGGVSPLAVQDLPTWLSVDDPRLALVTTAPWRPLIALGLDDERSQPVVVDVGELLHMLVLGPAGAGKTSVLASCTLQVLRRCPETRCYLVTPRPSALNALSETSACVATARNTVQLGELLDGLESVVEERREALRNPSAVDGSGAPPSPLLLVLDDYELLRQDDDFYDLESRLARLARRGTAVGLHVLLGGSNIELRDARDDLVRYISQLRVGVLLQPDIEFDGDVFSVRLRRMVEAAPVGRGYLVVRQQQLLFQAATPQVEGETLMLSIQRRLPA